MKKQKPGKPGFFTGIFEVYPLVYPLAEVPIPTNFVLVFECCWIKRKNLETVRFQG